MKKTMRHSSALSPVRLPAILLLSSVLAVACGGSDKPAEGAAAASPRQGDVVRDVPLGQTQAREVHGLREGQPQGLIVANAGRIKKAGADAQTAAAERDALLAVVRPGGDIQADAATAEGGGGRCATAAREVEISGLRHRRHRRR